jgi:hypothetical protein
LQQRRIAASPNPFPNVGKLPLGCAEIVPADKGQEKMHGRMGRAGEFVRIAQFLR